jgi:hypothetical protein
MTVEVIGAPDWFRQLLDNAPEDVTFIENFAGVVHCHR